MPKLIIKDESHEEPVKLLLVHGSDKVTLKAKRGGGPPYSLLSVKENGTVVFHSSISASLGFDLDDNGNLKVATD